MEDKHFTFSNKIDIHALDPTINIASLVSIASEHNFRAIVVCHARIEELAKEVKKRSLGILPVTIIDYPCGMSSQDVRSYSVISAVEKGAKEIEIVAPYHYIAASNFKKLNADIECVTQTCEKLGVTFKYILDQSHVMSDDRFTSKVFRILASNKVKNISASVGYFDRETSIPDSVMWVRDIKKKTGAKVKAFLHSTSVQDLVQFPKAGAEIVGINWRNAPNVVHEYEHLINKEM